MKYTEDAQPKAIYLKDYRPSFYTIKKTELAFYLAPNATEVRSKLVLEPHSFYGDTHNDLILHGEKLQLKGVSINGKVLDASHYRLTDHDLTISSVVIPQNKSFELQTTVTIDPENNTSCEGLYRSGALYCTQCEPHGFRKITYYIDRPDVMSRFTVKIIGESQDSTPILLSNGNLIEQGIDPKGRPFAIWEDPFLKPSYLFALVAGDLARIEDTFTTLSGRKVDLHIYVDKGDEDQADYAMDSLKRSMKWDEDVYGREYDLDLFMIVAVSTFNMGAMENKGLNIFNSKYILAKAETATDVDYEGIEGVVAHEYFHNWTGNRVTCRDWFQLCLKEGLTVFRDQHFSADQRSHAVKRIEDVLGLKAAQFSEDSGPLAHSVRPESYIQMNNFYTSTVYEKGAELCGMLYTMLGKDGFRKGTDLYFERHDGQAVRVEEFLAALADANGKDLSQFMLWYKQAGTPVVTVKQDYDEAARSVVLTISQHIPDTPGQTNKQPHQMPLKLAFIGEQTGKALETKFQGKTAHEHVIVIEDAEQVLVFENINEQPILSFLRDFSAPVNVKHDLTTAQRLTLLQHDTDSFNRWNQSQSLSEEILLDLITNGKLNVDKRMKDYAEGIGAILKDSGLDPHFKSLCLNVPTIADLMHKVDEADPQAIHEARKFLRHFMAESLQSDLQKAYDTSVCEGEYKPTAEDAGKRSLRNAALAYLTLLQENNPELAWSHYESANNMTDKMGALSILAHVDSDYRVRALDDFYNTYKQYELVIDKWFGAQARTILPNALENIKKLLEHPDFTWKNPNRVRSVIGVFAHGNMLHFHDKEGKGYEFIADCIIKIDDMNPQLASRLTTAFESWKRLTPLHAANAEKALKRILAKENLSSDVYEIAGKSVG